MKINPWKENQALHAEIQVAWNTSRYWEEMAGKRQMEAFSLQQEVDKFNKSLFGKGYNIARSLRFWVFGGRW